MTERVFNISGIGSHVVNADLRLDYPTSQGTLIVVAALYLLINFAIDMIYLMVDVRVKYEGLLLSKTNDLNFWQILLKRRSVLIGVIILGTLIFFAIFADFKTQNDPSAISVPNRLSPSGKD